MLLLDDFNIEWQAFLDFISYKYTFSPLISYANDLKRSLCHYASINRYSPVNNDQPFTYVGKSRTQYFHKILAECIEEVKLISTLITNSPFHLLYYIRPGLWWQFKYRCVQTAKVKMIYFGSFFRWLFRGLGSIDENVQASKIVWTYSCQIKTSNNSKSKKSPN